MYVEEHRPVSMYDIRDDLGINLLTVIPVVEYLINEGEIDEDDVHER